MHNISYPGAFEVVPKKLGSTGFPMGINMIYMTLTRNHPTWVICTDSSTKRKAGC